MRPADETPYTTGLHEVADGVFAWLQPDGGWGWSNAGLLATDGGSLLVDTLFDLELTRTMLDAMAPITDTRPIGTLVNTHANGDHCYGNSLVTDAEIVTTEASSARHCLSALLRVTREKQETLTARRKSSAPVS